MLGAYMVFDDIYFLYLPKRMRFLCMGTIFQCGVQIVERVSVVDEVGHQNDKQFFP